MKNIYFVGAPTEAKGIEDFNYLANQLKSFNFYWFTFNMNTDFKQKYNRINFIVGKNDQAMKELIKQKMDLFISCSHYEGFCLPIAEAILLEKPVISYDLEEVVSEFGNHINYVSQFKKEGFASKIQLLSQEKNLKHKLMQAHQFIESNYSPDQVCDKLVSILF